MRKNYYIMAVFVTVLGCGEHASPDTAQQAAPDSSNLVSDSLTTTPVASSARSQANEAQSFAKRLRATPNATTFDEVLAQMPRDMVPAIGLVGRVRTYTWTFSDGSRLIARFSPSGGEGSGQGLVLQGIDLL
jgi:hypothetical protein